MHIVGCVQRTLMTLIVLAVATSPSVTQNAIISGSATSGMTGTVTRVSSVVGGDAELPCDTRPPMRNDSLLLVVWYRDDNPVYSYDTRVIGPTAHWADEAFMDRAQWVSEPSSSLRVHPVQARDRAVYRCRVDYQISPTRNYRIALDVVELPSKPAIFDEYGKEISGTVGPYNEGSDFKLICIVNGGVPTPRIQWLQGDRVLSTLGASELQKTKLGRSLTLVIRNASRSHQSALYTCAADNMLLAPPQKTSVKVELYLKPLTVEILSREQPLSVGRKTDLWCRSSGARPPATITWWLGGKKMESITKQSLHEGNETQSLLQWTPLKEHNGKPLICRAEHPRFNQSTIESKFKLNVYYVPVAATRLGAKMNPNDIEEGDDVYFWCDVDANPPAYKVVWEHNDIILTHNLANGVILSANANLALRNVSRHQAGKYTCTASNVEGDGKSPPLHVQIVYKPLCRRREMEIVGAALQEPSQIVCEVDAFPPPSTFEWTLNNSAGSIKVNPDRFTVDGKEGRSVLTYTPVADMDYGALSCRATNLAGQQSSPCLYTLLPATRPDQPTNCTIYNLTNDSLDLICIPGYEGGLQCVYIAEVWTIEGLVVNASKANAVWNLGRLGPFKELKIIVYAANARGRSEHVSFTVETALKMTRPEAQEAWEVNWAMRGVIGAAITIAFVLCLALVVTRLRQRTPDYEASLQIEKAYKVSTKSANHSPMKQDDKNPDVIPFGKDFKSSCDVEPPLESPPYRSIVSPLMRISQSTHSIHKDVTSNTLHTNAAASDTERIGILTEDKRSVTSETLSRKREVVTTRTPLLADARESCV